MSEATTTSPILDPGTTQPTNPNPSSDPAAGGQPPANWYDALPDTLKADQHVVKYTSVEELAKGYQALTRRMGAPPEQLLKIPTSADDAEGWGAIHKVLGVPETAEGYKFQIAEGAADDAQDLAARLGELGVKAKFSTAQMDAAVGFLNEAAKAKAEADQAATEAAAKVMDDTLRKEWGAKYDVYKGEIGRLIRANGGDEAIEELEGGLGNNIALSRMLAKIVDRMAEPERPGGGDAGRGGAGDVLTPTQARAARLVLENDPQKGAALRDAKNPLHRQVSEERMRLLQLEGGQKPD